MDSTNNECGLTSKQVEAISALIDGKSVASAAKSCKIAERTLYRWMRDDVFRREYMACRREAFSHAASLTQKYAPMAVETLAQIMCDKKGNTSARVAAASALLKFGRDAIEIDDVACRLENVERKLNVSS